QPRRTASSRQCKPMDLGSVLDPVKCEIEDVKIAQPPALGDLSVFAGQRARQNEGYHLLAETAMRAQTVAGEPRKVVLGPRRADDGVVVAERNEISLSVDRHF